MISILKIRRIVFYVLVSPLFFPWFVFAQDSLTLSVSPTLFEMTANPGQTWESKIKVINSNPYDIDVYTDTLHFAPQGESGQPKFFPVLKKETGGQTLAEWINIKRDVITIPAEQTLEIPFSITVPENAPPGGHYAAISVGTKSLNAGDRKTQVETSQVVTSLIFLRVTGDVKEEGVIREFRSQSLIAERPEMEFVLRFQNKGNVHLLPRGDIRIFNMWGQERGVIPINRQTMFGNVLPNSVRKYTFKWSGQWSLADIGRYKAIVTLAYGQNGTKFADAETAFWVLPWKIILTVLLVLAAFVALLTWAIKAYIRRMLSLAGLDPRSEGINKYRTKSRQVKAGKQISVMAPVEEGILDLRERFRRSDGSLQRLKTLLDFIREYRKFFLVLTAVLFFLVALIGYIKNASVSERPYEVTIEGAGNNVKISSEEIKYNNLKKEVEKTNNKAVTASSSLKIKIVNQSGVSGLAARLRLKLEKAGYEISDLSSELGASEERTVIIYAPEYADAALALSKLVPNSLLSAYAKAASADTPITIYVGKNLENELQ